MKPEYYKLRGWDAHTGLQTRKKLNQLGLSDIADELDKWRYPAPTTITEHKR